MSAATIRSRMRRTAARIARVTRLRRALARLQARRRRQLSELAGLGPTVMYDSVTLEVIPRDAPAVAGYVGGRWPTYARLAIRWPRARRLSIAVAARYDAQCLDVEPGDARPDQAAEWVRRQHARGIARPVLYTSVSAAPALLRDLHAHGIERSHILLWTAHYTHRPHLCNAHCGFGFNSNADATQWTNRAHGRNLDESLLAPGFWT